MKQIILFILASFISAADCQAQLTNTQYNQKFSKAFNSKQRTQGLQRQINAMQSSTASRLIGISTYSNGIRQDTVRYYYSHGRGSWPVRDYNDLQYSPGYRLYPTQDGYTKITLYPEVSCDSLLYFDSYDSTHHQPSHRIVVNYRPDNKMASDTQYTYNGGSRTVVVWEYSYNASGYISQERGYDSIDPTGQPQSLTALTYYGYDAQNREILDSDVSPVVNLPEQKTLYFYDKASNLLLSESFAYDGNGKSTIDDSIIYAYNTNNLMTSYHEYSFVNGKAYMSLSDSFRYTGSSFLWTYEIVYVYNFNNKSLYSIFNGYLNQAGDNYDSTKTYQPGIPRYKSIGFFNVDGTLKEVDDYSTYNGVDTATGDVFFAGAKNHLYYEQYTTSGIVPTPVVVDHNNITLYPNPADNALHIKIDDNAIATSKGAVLVCIDMMGRRVLTQTVSEQATIELNTAELPAGMYHIHVITNGQMLQGQPFIKK